MIKFKEFILENNENGDNYFYAISISIRDAQEGMSEEESIEKSKKYKIQDIFNDSPGYPKYDYVYDYCGPVIKSELDELKSKGKVELTTFRSEISKLTHILAFVDKFVYPVHSNPLFARFGARDTLDHHDSVKRYCDENKGIKKFGKIFFPIGTNKLHCIVVYEKDKYIIGINHNAPNEWPIIFPMNSNDQIDFINKNINLALKLKEFWNKDVKDKMSHIELGDKFGVFDDND